MSNVRILEGTYKIRGNDTSVAGMVFPLVDEFRFGSNGGFVTVDAREVAGFPDRNIKIRVEGPASYELTDAPQLTQREETDEETIERLRERFDLSLIHISEPTRPY